MSDCLRTTSNTACLIRAASAAPLRPGSREMTMSRISLERGRLPAWVVKMLLLLRFMAILLFQCGRPVPDR